jgi:hypothetical protein
MQIANRQLKGKIECVFLHLHQPAANKQATNLKKKKTQREREASDFHYIVLFWF